MAKNWLIQPLPGELAAKSFGQIVSGKLDADNDRTASLAHRLKLGRTGIVVIQPGAHCAKSIG
jgi:hypothetical protein